MGFDKSDFFWDRSFIIDTRAAQTSELHFVEQYWPDYTILSQALNTGRTLYDEMQYSEAFQNLEVFLADNPLIPSFSLYPTAYDLIVQTIESFIQYETERMTVTQSEFERAPKKLHLTQLEEMVQTVRTARSEFDPFLTQKSFPESAELNASFDTFQTSLENASTAQTAQFRNMHLALLSQGGYKDYKHLLYIDFIVRLLTETPFIQIIETPLSIDSERIEAYPLLQRDLEDLYWANEFDYLLYILNENIQSGRFLDDSTLSHLEEIQSTEPQPYYHILAGFDALAEGLLAEFENHLQEAFITCTDAALLYGLENWYISIQAHHSGISRKVIDTINAGLSDELSGELDEAEAGYKRAMKLAGQFAPSMFLLGRVNHKKDELFVAERYFTQALEVYPGFMAPRIYKLEFLIDGGEYNSALEEVNSTLETSPYWFFFYMKAKILYYLNRYEEAVNTLTSHCLSLNDNNFDQFILLGDISLDQEKLDQAQEYYYQAGNIDPENEIYSQRMTNLRQLKKDTSPDE